MTHCAVYSSYTAFQTHYRDCNWFPLLFKKYRIQIFRIVVWFQLVNNSKSYQYLHFICFVIFWEKPFLATVLCRFPDFGILGIHKNICYSWQLPLVKDLFPNHINFRTNSKFFLLSKQYLAPLVFNSTVI